MPQNGAVELAHLRGSDSKHFRNPDGTYSVVVIPGQHYEESPGRWADVDLDFYPIGFDQVADKRQVITRVNAAGIEVVSRGGQGIRWVTPGAPVVSGRGCSHDDQGVTWEYLNTVFGVKATGRVAVKRGPQTYTFLYARVGGNPDFVIDGAGNAVAGEILVPAPVVIGADGVIYPAGTWQLSAGPRIGFTFDDSQIPDAALPYLIDPTTTINTGAASDSGKYAAQGPVWPPNDTYVTWYGATGMSVGRSTASGGQYKLEMGYLRFNTNGILPARATLTGATVRLTNSAYQIADPGRRVTLEYYTVQWIPQYSTVVSGSANAGVLGASGAVWEFPLTDPLNNLSWNNYTIFRAHMTGAGAPINVNTVTFYGFSGTPSSFPALEITYTLPPAYQMLL